MCTFTTSVASRGSDCNSSGSRAHTISGTTCDRDRAANAIGSDGTAAAQNRISTKRAICVAGSNTNRPGSGFTQTSFDV
jgi:hypothetical protein